MGSVSSVESLFSFQILIVLSASQVISLEPDRSKVEAKIPLSASREPVVEVCGVCCVVCVVFKLERDMHISAKPSR